MASRVLAYGPQYTMEYVCPRCNQRQKVTVNISSLIPKNVDFQNFQKNSNNFSYQLPMSKINVTFKLLTYGQSKNIQNILKGYKKVGQSGSITTMLIHSLLSINGQDDRAKITQFVNNKLSSFDSLALRKYINSISPTIDTVIPTKCQNGQCDYDEGVQLSIQADFF